MRSVRNVKIGVADLGSVQVQSYNWEHQLAPGVAAGHRVCSC